MKRYTVLDQTESLFDMVTDDIPPLSNVVPLHRPAPAPPFVAASKPQLEYICSLRERAGLPREIPEGQHPRSLRTAGKMIDILKAHVDKYGDQRKPKKTAAFDSPASKNVPEGRYALPNAKGDGIVFYKVSKPTEGHWTGFVFVDIQASDELYPVKNWKQREEVLRKIGLDPKGAAQLYGQKLEHCAICGRTLTNDESRAFGIGPKCRGDMGW